MNTAIFLCLFIVRSHSSSPEENLNMRHGRLSGDFVDGDIKVTKAEKARGSITNLKWPNGIAVYEIHSSLLKEKKAMNAIQQGFAEWTQNTCIRFKNRTNEAAYILFYRGSGCWSHVGRTGTRQLLSLATACWHGGIVAHEIGHALGFYHEQSRPDRDQYVEIKYANIMDDAIDNFKKYSADQINSMGTPYDYGSIMHYGAAYFSKNGKPTIIPKKAGVSIGNRRGISQMDAQEMRLMYNCDANATTSSPVTIGLFPVNGSLCTFDKGLCLGWKQQSSDEFDWTLISGSTPSRGTGPLSGHGGKGKYMYMEASWPRQTNDTAKLSFSYIGSGQFCMTFYYFMHGVSVGRLNVYNENQLIFNKSGDQGQFWKKAEVPLSANGQVQGTFEGMTGNGWQGDIAIDDVALRHGSCFGSLPSSTNSKPTVASTPPQTAAPPLRGCGIKPSTSRIVGGVDAKVNGWPWQAMLLTSSPEEQICGGSLVHPFWVVTAAHCVALAYSPSDLKVKLGAHYGQKVSGTVGTEQTINVAKIITHENYSKPVTYAHDIALIKLAQPAILGRGVGVVCLSNSSNVLLTESPNQKGCWITGWGTLSAGGKKPNVLQQASVPLVSNGNCSLAYPGKIDNSMLCAGLDEGGVDTCQGDSGGPLVCEINGRWYLEAVTSWGYGCASPRKYGVYARVGSVRSWILGKILMTPLTPPVTSLPPPPPSPPTPPAQVCTFESGLCPGMKQSTDDRLDWQLLSGKTPSRSTGPSSGHGGNGNYIYMEASSPAKDGNNAKLEMSASGKPSCLVFYYHMYGSEMGILNVFDGSFTVFTKSGDQGNLWHKIKLTVFSDRVIFEGIRGRSYNSDIAVDDISLRTGAACGACVDNPKYADICPSIAACGSYCNDHKFWSQNNCAKSCNICYSGPVPPPPPPSSASARLQDN